MTVAAPANAKNVTPTEPETDAPTEAGIEQANEQAAREVLALSPVRSQLKLTETDKATIHGLITAQLGTDNAVTPFEFAYFIRVAELRGLNPLFREVHLIKDRDGRITAQTGIDGFRKLAEETGEYRGQTAPEWGPPYDGEVGGWVGRPGYVRVGVHRLGFEEPVWGEAWLEEDGQLSASGPISQWKTRPRTMLAKVAEARALRKAFPRQMAGLYTDDEIPGNEERFVPPEPAGQLPPPPPAPPAAPLSPSAAPSPAQDAPGAAQPAPTPASAAPTARARPAASDGLQGPLEKSPDGVREVKLHGELAKKYLPAADSHRKLEVVFKVNNRRHTAMLFGDLAYQTMLLEPREGEIVYIRGGTVEEITWQEGKPKKKEVWGATELYVQRDGDWVSAMAAVIVMPMADMPGRGPETLPTRPSTSASSPAQAPTSDSSEPPSDVLALASSASSPSSTASPSPAPVRKTPGANNEVATLHVRIVDPAPHWGTSNQRDFVSAKLVEIATGELVQAAAGGEDMEPCFGTRAEPLWKVGDEAVVMGHWQSGWLIVAAMGPPGAAAA